MAEEKKEDGPFVSKYSQMKTDELLDIFESWNADESADKRREVEQKTRPAREALNRIEDSYLVKKRGAKGEAENEKIIPKSYSLDSANAELEAEELLNHLVLEVVKREIGEEKAVEFYKKNPEHLQGYARSKGIDYERVIDDLVKNKNDIGEARLYNHIKQQLGEIGVDKDHEHFLKAQAELQKLKHRKGLKSAADEAIKEHGYTLDDKLMHKPEHILQHYAAHLQKQFNKRYRLDNPDHFKKAESYKK